MFVTTKEDLKRGSKVVIIGMVSNKDNNKVSIKTNTGVFSVKYKDILSYATGSVIIQGVVDQDLTIIEDSIYPITESLDLNFIDEVITITKQFPLIF